MKKTLMVVLFLTIIALLGRVSAFEQTLDDVKMLPECKYCGMDREHFAQTRMVVYHGHGTMIGLCSINCAALDHVRELEDAPMSFKVGDYNTKELIEARKAYWVIGGSKQGVMAIRGKWAFKKKSDAKAFIARYGGRIGNFEKAMKTSYEDMYEDMRQLSEMKRKHACSTSAAKGTDTED